MAEKSRHFYEFGGFRLDADERVLLRGDEVVPLAPKAVETLVVLVERRGHVVSKDDLMQRVWADAYVEENNLNQAVSALRKALGQGPAGPVFVETLPKRGYRFVAPVASDTHALRPVEDAASARLEPVGGAMPLGSSFYMVRPEDEQLHDALGRQDSVVLIKGARQIGKTSMLARGIQDAREAGARVVLTDFQDLASSDLTSSEALFLTLGKAIAEQLDLDVTPKSRWDPEDSANTNFGRFVRREVLAGDAHVVWGLDEVDRLFPYPFASEVFGLFRSWHNRRALDPTGPWHRLTLAMAFATEANLFITDVNQSPFNVGTRLTLHDFTAEQVAELNRRYGSPLRDEKDLTIFGSLVGGHPYLVRQGLHTLATGTTLSDLLENAPSVEGPFGDHLSRMLYLLSRDPALAEAMRDVLEARRPPDEASFFRLRSGGLLHGDSVYDAHPRCLLYALFLERHLAKDAGEA
jgi:DNA-binding winged helix-turn-helix (wHTH) protein